VNLFRREKPIFFDEGWHATPHARELGLVEDVHAEVGAYEALTDAELAVGLVEIDAALKTRGRAGDEAARLDLQRRLAKTRTGTLVLTFQRPVPGSHGTQRVLDTGRAALPVPFAAPLLLSSDSPELEVARRAFAAGPEGVRRDRIAALAHHQREMAQQAADEARARRLAAWQQRPRMERAMVRLAAAQGNAVMTPMALAEALANEPEHPTHLPPGDMDVGAAIGVA